MNFSLNQLYRCIRISKQAVIQYQNRQQILDQKVAVLICEADKLRAEHPGCGVEKMYYTLNPGFIGRDRFIDLFMTLGYRVRKSKNYRRTTYASAQACYHNLIKGMLLHSPHQVWQSDITYIKVGDRFYYAVFIIDIYTKKIVGYHVSDSLRADANLKALNMATVNNPFPRIHHSDKGSQYIYKPYTSRLQNNGTAISMGQTAMDNAYAERINQTIKYEYIQYWKPKSFKQLKTQIKKAVKHYNNKRLHNHLNRLCPVDFESDILNLPLHRRPMVKIYTDGYIKMKRTSSPLSSFAQKDLLDPICPIL